MRRSVRASAASVSAIVTVASASLISTSQLSGPTRPVTRVLGTHGAMRWTSVIAVQTVSIGAATENAWSNSIRAP